MTQRTKAKGEIGPLVDRIEWRLRGMPSGQGYSLGRSLDPGLLRRIAEVAADEATLFAIDQSRM